MKFYFIGLLLCFSSALSAQTFVSTEPQKGNVLMEEYTGIKCGYCPQGHIISSDLLEKYPQRMYVINVHQSTLAAGPPEFRTSFADALAQEAQIAGLPSATINRHLFEDMKQTSLGDRRIWAECVEKLIDKPSCVNIAAKADLDYASRTMNLTVEVYYTADAENSNNFLHIALLEDGILGPQQGSSANPSMEVPGGYLHQHMLRDLLTGQWGDTIKQTKKGSFISKTYTYQVPEHFREVPCDLGNISLLVFVSESKNEILNVTESYLNVFNVPSYPLVKQLNSAQLNSCEAEASFEILVENKGAARINEIGVQYSLNQGAEDTIYWTDDYIAKNQEKRCIFPAIPVVIGEENTLYARIISINGEAVSDTLPIDSISGECVFTKEVYTAEDVINLKVIVSTDQYGSEVSWRIFDTKGRILQEVEYEEDLEKEGTKTYEHVVGVPKTGCYIFEIFDKGMDGINSVYGEGNYKIEDDKGNSICQGDGKFKEKDYRIIALTSPNSIKEEGMLSEYELKLFPNPSSGNVFLSFKLTKAETLSLHIFDAQGKPIDLLEKRRHSAGNHQIEISLHAYPAGTYYLIIESETNRELQKIQLTK